MDTESVMGNLPQKKFDLTPCELEIVSAVVSGYSNKEIAESRTVSEDAVKHHLSSIFNKFGVSTRLDLALLWVRNISDGGRDDADEVGIAVKKPKRPNLNSGSSAASLDEEFG